MKNARLAFVVALGIGLTPIGALAEKTHSPQVSTIFRQTEFLSTNTPAALPPIYHFAPESVSIQKFRSNSSTGRQFQFVPIPGTTNRFHLIENPSTNVWPAPGVYKTEPYTCIVKVPGQNPGDKAVINPGTNGLTMPQIKPDLRFIPRN